MFFLGQVGNRIAVYFQYKTSVNVKVTYPLGLDFPTVIICNQNSFRWLDQSSTQKCMASKEWLNLTETHLILSDWHQLWNGNFMHHWTTSFPVFNIMVSVAHIVVNFSCWTCIFSSRNAFSQTGWHIPLSVFKENLLDRIGDLNISSRDFLIDAAHQKETLIDKYDKCL